MMDKEASIEELAYDLHDAKKKGRKGPIFFLGAGASVTGGIPLAGGIVKRILEDFKDNPRIRKLKEADKNYPTLMQCIGPPERKELLKGYIDKSKINVTHIYLAQLMSEGYADYILTTNFDNLMVRALALYNHFPPTYDIAILKELTTSKLEEKSVVHLHGRHHGMWLLNTADEMEKVKKTVPKIIDKIADERPWIFLGYSGEDPIFDHLKEYARFDNGLYWVKYKDNPTSSKVRKGLIDKPNSFVISGYDADSFMLSLNRELKLSHPNILHRPFSLLKSMLENIRDIDEEEYFQGVKERLALANEQVRKAVEQFEEGNLLPQRKAKADLEIDQLKKKIISIILNNNFDAEEIAQVEEEVKGHKSKEIKEMMSDLWYNWGNILGETADHLKPLEAEKLYRQAFDKYQKSTAENPTKHEAYNNWGIYLGNLADHKEGTERENLYQEAFTKYREAIKIKDTKALAYYNWGGDLLRYGRKKSGKEQAEAYDLAEKKLVQCNQLGGPVYNLACIYALKGNTDQALYFLGQSLENEEITVQFVADDPDWENLQDLPKFNILLEKFTPS